LKGRKDDTLPVLTEYLAEIIRSRLPNLLQEAPTWNLLYSMDQHGARLSTLYRNIKDQGPCIVVLKNSENEVFGAFISEPFDPSNRGFFGTPECFLFKSNKYQFKKFSATGLNQYFMLADPSFIAMGGGNGNFGFYVDEDIQFGYTSVCDTFENEILTEDNEFECYGCEIWGLEY
ncbi:TLD-domain-containing protein, partial [Anaeromyces robustus]